MRNLGIITAFIFLALCLSAQDEKDVQLFSSKEFKKPKNTVVDKVSNIGNKGFYIVRKSIQATNPNKIYVELYNKKLGFITGKKIDLSYNKKIRKYEDLVFLKNNPILLTSYHNRGKGKNYLFYEKLDTDLETGKLVKIAEMDTDRLNSAGNFYITTSLDSANLLVINELEVGKKEKQKIAVSVFDSELNKLWKRQVSLPYTKKNYQIVDYQIDNAGSIYLLGFAKKDKKDKKKKELNYNYSLLTFSDSGETKKEYKIKLKNKYINSLQFKPNKNDGTVVCTGFYSDQDHNSSKGIFYAKIDPIAQKFVSSNTQDFEARVIEQDYSNRKIKKSKNKNKELELEDYEIKDIVLRSDGGALVFSEQVQITVISGFNNSSIYNPYPIGSYYYRQYRDYQRRNSRDEYRYEYQDILVTNINPDGTIQWNKRIRKDQNTVNDFGFWSSFSKSIINDKIYIIFNDDARNLDRFNSSEETLGRAIPYIGRNGVLTLVSIDKNGEMNKKAIFENRDMEIRVVPSFSKQTYNDQMTLYGVSNRKFKLLNLSL